MATAPVITLHNHKAATTTPGIGTCIYIRPGAAAVILLMAAALTAKTFYSATAAPRAVIAAPGALHMIPGAATTSINTAVWERVAVTTSVRDCTRGHALPCRATSTAPTADAPAS